MTGLEIFSDVQKMVSTMLIFWSQGRSGRSLRPFFSPMDPVLPVPWDHFLNPSKNLPSCTALSHVHWTLP